MKKSIAKIFLSVVCSVLIINTTALAQPKTDRILIEDCEITASALPLFVAYPGLATNGLSYINLGNLQETPIIHAEKLEQQGAKFYIKNDGVYGTDKTGKKIFTGNKRRKLEFLLADTLANNANHIYTVGAAGSNHAVATAAYAHELGLPCTLVLGPQRNTRYAQRNLKLDLFYGADFVTCETRGARQQTFKNLADNKKEGEYFIPIGGSNEIGAVGFVSAAFELKKQIDSGLMAEPDVIYIPISSVGTAAGLIVGCRAVGLHTLVRVVCIDDTAREEVAKDLSSLIYETSKYLNNIDKNFNIILVAPDNLADLKVEIINDSDITGENQIKEDHAQYHRHRALGFGSYALTTAESAKGIEVFFSATGIKLDGTYAGKAFAACLQDLTSGKLNDKTVLFWNTFCPGDFNEYTDVVDIQKLPEVLQKYINVADEYPIQEADQGL